MHALSRFERCTYFQITREVILVVSNVKRVLEAILSHIGSDSVMF